MRNEQAAAAAAAAEQRKAELRHFVDDFQTGVGGIIDKVMNSSGEVRAHSRQLTEKPRAPPPNSPANPPALRNTASSTSRTAAAASDELSSSIAEITRRVQESNGHRRRSRPSGRRHRPAHHRAVAGGNAHWRRGEADHLDRRADNLLALNATIERHGRAIAVALCGGRPGEGLAWANGEATEEISSQIGNMRSRRGVGGPIKAIGQTIEPHHEIANSISRRWSSRAGDGQHRPERPRRGQRTASVASTSAMSPAGRRRDRRDLSRMFEAAQALSGEAAPEGRGGQVPQRRACGVTPAGRRRRLKPAATGT